MAVVAAHIFGSTLDRRVAALNLPAAASQQLAREHIDLATAAVPHGLDEEKSRQTQRAIDVSFVDCFRIVMLAGAALALASAVVGRLAVSKRRGAR